MSQLPSTAERTERWQVSGSAPEVYQRYLVPAIFGPWAPRLVDLTDPKLGDHVLDVACGTGVVAREAAERVGPKGEVIGLDLNPGMLAVASSLPTVPGATIEWREGDAIALPLSDSGFNVVFCQLGLQYFTDRAKALREMHRVLIPGGRLGLLVWRSIRYSIGFSVLADAVGNHVSLDAAKVVQAPFSLGDIGDLRGLVTSAEFHDLTILLDVGTVRFPSSEAFVLQYGAGSPLASHLAKVAEESRAALIRDVSSALMGYLDDGGVAFPIEAHIAVACK